MKYLKPPPQFIVEDQDQKAELKNIPLSPTHEELSGLHWFRALQTLCETIGGGAEWTTGKIAYENGSRKISIETESLTNRNYNEPIDWIFYPQRGTLVFKPSGGAVKKGIDFSSLPGWDSALFHLYLTIISRELLVDRIAPFKTMFERRDSDTLINIFDSANDRRANMDNTILPDEFLVAILKELDPEGSKRLRFRISLGLR
jgi:hypothetical protein